MLEYISSWQEFFDKISSFSILYYPLNFFLSFFVSYFSFKVLLPGIKTFDQLLKHLLTIGKLEERIKRDIRNFTLEYALVTGLAASAIIAIQFRGLNFSSAIIYGILGAYFLKDHMILPLGKKIGEEIKRQVDSRITATKTEAQEDYKSELAKIEELFKDNGE